MIRSRRKRKRLAEQNKVNKRNIFKEHMRDCRVRMEDAKFDFDEHIKTL